MIIEVKVAVVEKVRKPDYDGSYVLIVDKGETMVIEVEGLSPEERIEQLEIENTTLSMTVDSIFTEVLPILFNI